MEESTINGKLYYNLVQATPELKDLLGEKAVMLGEMERIGLGVPPGVALPKWICTHTLKNGGRLNQSVCEAIREAVGELETTTELKYGAGDNPLLLSVRVSASVYMHGIMGSFLNVGLTAQAVDDLGKSVSDPLVILDNYRLYLEGMAQHVFRVNIDDILERTAMKFGRLLLGGQKGIRTEDLESLNRDLKRKIEKSSHHKFPENDPFAQLFAVIEAVYKSWDSDMAKRFREVEGLSDSESVAIVLQAMVPWSFAPDSGTGTVYTRNPRTGARELFGFFYPHLVSWSLKDQEAAKCDIKALENTGSPLYGAMKQVCEKLENHFKCVQKVEFAVHSGGLVPLQTRNAALEPEAAIQSAVDMAGEGMIEIRDALLRVSPDDVDQIIHQRWSPARQSAIGYGQHTWQPSLLVEEARGHIMSGALREILEWADKQGGLKVRTNADLPQEALLAREMGAVGIGLCRTERMFRDPERLPVFQDLILCEDPDERRELLKKLSEIQKEDFAEIFRIMQGLPVTIRLLDPPLRDFMPRYDTLVEQAARAPESELPRIKSLMRKVHNLQETNPMLGFRGCRMGILYPEIYEMQVRAIFETALALYEEGLRIHPEIMIPLVGDYRELSYLRSYLEKVIAGIVGVGSVPFPYAFGTMIEIPRAALTADEIAGEVDFFSFGTNDLSQTTFGFSREDAEAKFLFYYLDHKILDANPFETLDIKGVGRLMTLAIEGGRRIKPDLMIGICGQQSKEPDAIRFCDKIGLDYVSCAPMESARVRLTVAQTALKRLSRGAENGTVPSRLPG